MNFQFDSLQAFLSMKGHGPYVWSCYLIVYAILMYLSVSPLLQKRAFIKQQKKIQHLQQAAEK